MRCAAKIDQKQLAVMCEISQSYLQKVELGKLPVSRPLLQKIKAHCA
jgi:predicted transcriptional regulator